MVAMASGSQVDQQRDERWPNQTVAGSLRVKLESNESDYESDDDEEIGPRLGYDPETGILRHQGNGNEKLADVTGNV
jgi:hypothetical protein